MPPFRPALLLALIAMTGALSPREACACDKPDCGEAREAAGPQRVPAPCNEPDCDKE